MNRRRVGILLIGAGIILGVITGVVVFLQSSEAQRVTAAQPRRYVAVAASDIPERTVIAANQVTFAALPEEAVPPLALSHNVDVTGDLLTSTRQPLLARIVNQITPQRIYKGEVILLERLGEERGKNIPAYSLPTGKVAFTFPVKLAGGIPPNDRINLAFVNAIRLNDFIDIYYSTFEGIPHPTSTQEEDHLRDKHASEFLQTRRVLQNIRVIQVGHFPDASGKAVETTKDERLLTLEVTADDALVLKWLKDVGTLVGNIDFVLRSPLDHDILATTPVNLDVMTQRGLGQLRGPAAEPSLR